MPKLTQDPAVRYAEDVLEERIVSGEFLKLAAKRMIGDFGAKHLYFDRDAAKTMYDFCENECTVVDQATNEVIPFALLDWQKFIHGNLYGWKVKDIALDPLERITDSRRFRTAYIETGKGSGKSPFAGSTALKGLVGDGEKNPEIYICAKTENQALIPWRDIRDMVLRNPKLAPKKGLCEIYGGAKEGRIVCQATGGFIRTVAYQSSGAGVSGPRPHMVLVEEYHEHLTDTMREMLDDGKKGRNQPLTMIITNAGPARVGPCWEERVRATQVLRGVLEGDDYFCVIYAIDKPDIEGWIDNQECWPKANPSLGHVIRSDYILGQISKAKHSRSKLRHVERLNMTVWPDAGGDWLEWDQWEPVEVEVLDDDVLDECRLFVTLDLADKRDLCAMMYNWLHPSGHLYQRCRQFTPADTLPDKARTSNSYLEDWARRGPWGPTEDQSQVFLETAPGQVLDYIVPALRLREADERWGVECVAFDRHHMGQFMVAMDRLGMEYWQATPDVNSPYKKDREWKPLGSRPGIAMVAHPQGFEWSGPVAKAGLLMPTSITQWEDRILAEKPTVTIEVSPVLRWNLTCAVVTRNPQGFKKFDKLKAHQRYRQGKIDGLITGAMGAGIVDFEWPKPTGLAAFYATPDARASIARSRFGPDH